MTVLVQAIRSLDRRCGLASRHGARAYAGVSRLFGGLHRAVANQVAGLVGEQSAIVVDVGAGPGDLARLLQSRLPRATIVAVDPAREMRAVASSRGVLALDGQAERLPFESQTIDLVVSTLSAHHWDDPIGAFREFRRVLRPGGQARVYDVRFAGYGAGEARALAMAAGWASDSVRHEVLPERVFGLRPYSAITLDLAAS